MFSFFGKFFLKKIQRDSVYRKGKYSIWIQIMTGPGIPVKIRVCPNVPGLRSQESLAGRMCDRGARLMTSGCCSISWL